MGVVGNIGVDPEYVLFLTVESQRAGSLAGKGLSCLGPGDDGSTEGSSMDPVWVEWANVLVGGHHW